MRLRKLDLLRYGRFTDHTLDFGARREESDVTVVFGENEAGKSTAFSAWLDLLFGLPLQHPYDFVHARKELLVGATLDTPDGPLTLRRTGQRKDSLRDDNGRVVDERRLEVMLFGLDRDNYRTRFSLDDEVLRRGGEEIAQARGDLGQLLHAGSSGLSGFAEILKRAEEEVESFHKPRGRNTVLAQARNNLKAMDEAVSAARLDPRRYDELCRQVEMAETACQEAGAARNVAKRNLALREAADARRALTRDISEAQHRLSGYPDGPDMAQDALIRVSVATDAIARAREIKAEAAEGIKDAGDRLETLTPDPEGLRIGELFAELEAAEFDEGQPLVARASTAAVDITRRRAERDEAQAKAKQLAITLAGEGAVPEQIVLPREVLKGIREAAQELREKTRACGDARVALAEAQAGLGEAERMPEGVEALDDALGAYDGLPLDPEALAQTLRAREGEARQRAAGLAEGWRGLVDDGLVTQAELQRAERDLKSADDAVAQAEIRLSEAEEALAEREAEREGEAQVSKLVSDDEITESRARRDRLWSRHRETLDPETADDFESAMQRDDVAREMHARTVEMRTRILRLEGEIGKLAKTVARRRNDLTEARGAREKPWQAACRLAARLGLEEESGFAAMFEQRDALQSALEAALAAETAQTDLRASETARDAALAKLVKACEAIAGEKSGEEDALLRARRLRSDLEARRARIASRHEVAKMVRRLEGDVALRQTAQDMAETAYAERVAGLWCAGLMAEDMLQISEGLGELGDQQRIAEGLERRVTLLDAALAAFETRASPLREALDLTRDAQVDDILRAARHRAGKAKETMQKITQAKNDLAEAEREQGRQTRAIKGSEAEISKLFQGQEQSAGDDPPSAVRYLVERDELRTEIARLSARREALAEGYDAAALAEEEQNVDPLRTDMFGELLSEAEAARDAAIGRRGEARNARDQALQSAGGAEQAQVRAAQLEELRAAARHAAVTKIGLMAASGALRRLREDRRGSMLEATEQAFARMTGGEWQRLEAQPTGSGDRLVGIRGREMVGADAMSTATRGQLYLALRVAGHADFVNRYGPLPFVTDDILETFDDTRATAALALTGEMGRSGQAIMFTHHRHLVALARKVIPGVRIVELG